MPAALTLASSLDTVAVGTRVVFSAQLAAPATIRSVGWSLRSGVPPIHEEAPPAPLDVATAEFTPAAPGVYEVTAAVTDERGQTQTGVLYVTAHDNTFGTGFGAAGVRPGDGDNDGRVTARDALLLRDWLERSPAVGPFVPDGCDLDLSGKVDQADVALIQRAALQGQPLPTACLSQDHHPGALVRLVSPSLLTLGTRMRLEIGPTALVVEPFRPLLGYANALLPFELDALLPPEGTPATIDVVITSDGVAVDRLGIEVTRIPPPSRPARQALAEWFVPLTTTLESVTLGVAPLVAEVGGTVAEQEALEILLVAMHDELARVTASMANLAQTMSDPEADALYRLLRANGVEESFALASSLAGTESTHPLLDMLCTTARMRDLLNSAMHQINRNLALLAVGVTPGFLTPFTAPVSVAVIAVCTQAAAAVSLLGVVLATIPSPPASLVVTASPTSLTHQEVAFVEVRAPIDIGRAICRGGIAALVVQAERALSQVIAGFAGSAQMARNIIRNWPVSSQAPEFLRSIQTAIEQTIGSLNAGLTSIQQLSDQLQSLQNSRLCQSTTFTYGLVLDPATVLQPPEPATAGFYSFPSTTHALFTCTSTGSSTTATLTARAEACGVIYGHARVLCGGMGTVQICFGDNGNWLDDIYELEVDGLVISSPGIPITRVCPQPLRLTTGPHTAALRGLAAPDGVGTYFISFSGDYRNLTGPARSGTNLVPGIVHTWNFEVAARN